MRIDRIVQGLGIQDIFKAFSSRQILFFVLIITVNLDGYFGAHVCADCAACTFLRVFRDSREKAAFIKIIC
jgi:hypothetical protein